MMCRSARPPCGRWRPLRRPCRPPAAAGAGGDHAAIAHPPDLRGAGPRRLSGAGAADRAGFRRTGFRRNGRAAPSPNSPAASLPTATRSGRSTPPKSRPAARVSRHVIDRVGAGMERLSSAAPADDIIIISHGGAIRAACAYALGLTPHQALSLLDREYLAHPA